MDPALEAQDDILFGWMKASVSELKRGRKALNRDIHQRAAPCAGFIVAVIVVAAATRAAALLQNIALIFRLGALRLAGGRALALNGILLGALLFLARTHLLRVLLRLCAAALLKRGGDRELLLPDA